MRGYRLCVPLKHPLDPERHGSKATRLARIADLGGRVPPGLVVPAPLHAAALRVVAPGEAPRVPGDLAKALTAALADLGPPPWVVRTSAATEDLPGGSAAGLFRSEVGVGDVAGVVAAVERCWQAAHDERVGVYLGAIGRVGAPLPTVAILIQRQVRAPWAGVVFTRDPRQGPTSEHLRCELARGSTTAVTAGLVDPVAHTLDRMGTSSPPLPPDAGVTALDLVDLAGLAEQAAQGPANVELALTDAGAVVLQVRPITAFGAASRPIDLDDDGLPWRWDAEHNPAPLSPLHGSLVARLDRIPTLPFRMRCVGGYLYSAPRPGAPRAPEESPDQVCRAWPHRRRQIEKRLEDLEDLADGGAPLVEILPAFDRFYERYAALAGATLAGSHRRLAARMDDRLSGGDLAPEQIDEALGGVTNPLTAALLDLARQAAPHPDLIDGLAAGREVSAEPGGAAVEARLAEVIRRLGALPPVWDVAAPTLAESPAALRRTVAALARSGTRPGARLDAARSDPAEPHLYNLAADEEDDLLFARGLAVLRHALLRAGAHLEKAGRLDRPEDVFRLTIEPLVEALGSGPQSTANLRRLLTPEPTEPREGPITDRPILRGVGSGAGTVTAPALVVRRPDGRLEDLAGAARGRIVVCPTLVPSAVVLLAGASGIVTDHGGLLSHGAILARELGLPAVLATHSATARIATDDLLWLDAAQGLVIRLQSVG